MARDFRQSCKQSTLTVTTGLENTWVKLTSGLETRTAISVVNSGVSGDYGTSATIELLFHDTLDSAGATFTPTSEVGLKRSLKEGFSADFIKTIGLWIKSTTSNATVHVMEYEDGVGV